MKKLFYKMFSIFTLGLLGISTLGLVVNAQGNNTYGDSFGNAGSALGLGVTGAGEEPSDALITTVKTFINRVLGMLALIALIILLRGGFQMVTAAGDDAKYKNGFKILKQAAFGLAFIGLARLMVSLIFWLIGIIAGPGAGA